MIDVTGHLPTIHRGPRPPEGEHCTIGDVAVGGFADAATMATWRAAVEQRGWAMLSLDDVFHRRVPHGAVALLACGIGSAVWQNPTALRPEIMEGRIGVVDGNTTYWLAPDTAVFASSVGDPARSVAIERGEPVLIRVFPEAIVGRTLQPVSRGHLLVMLSMNRVRDRRLNVAYVLWREDGRHWAGVVLAAYKSTAEALRACDAMARVYQSPPLATGRRASADPQKANLYRWQHQHLCHAWPALTERMSESACRAFAEWVYDGCGWRRERPELIFSERVKRRCYYDGNRIVLADWGRSKGAILHEIAHHITGRRARGLASHGREYAAVLFWLVERFGGINAHFIQRSAKIAGVDADPDFVDTACIPAVAAPKYSDTPRRRACTTNPRPSET